MTIAGQGSRGDGLVGAARKLTVCHDDARVLQQFAKLLGRLDLYWLSHLAGLG